MRHFTVDEANEALAWVREAVARLRELARRGEATAARVSGNGSKGVDRSAGQEQLAEVLRTLTDAGIVVRDATRGLIDFPALAPSGRTYLLCWLHGEDAVEWWHWPEDGFAGRTPLSSPPR